MATQPAAVFTFALPEDTDSNRLDIYSSATKDGTYSQVATPDYEYGATTYAYASLDDTTWYKIRFYNTTDAIHTGPYSEAVYGGDFNKAAPFLAVSTTSDGANYSSTQDLLDYSNLTLNDVTAAQISTALKRARAVVDLRTSDMDLDRFTRTFKTDTARKKYNAALRIVKEAEINIALGNLFRAIADDLVVKNLRDTLDDTSAGSSSISVGSTSISGGGGLEDTAHSRELNLVADNYLRTGAAMLDSLRPPSIRLHRESDFVANPKFKYPFNGF